MNMCVLFVFYSIGSILNGLLFKLFDWKQIFCYYFIILFSITLVALKLYIKETPFDLITNYPAQFALRDLSWIAKQNGREAKHKIGIAQIQDIKHQYRTNMNSKQQAQFTMMDLFRFASLRMNVFLCFFLHLLIFFNFSAPILALDQFSSDLYINGMVFSVASLISSFFCYFFINDWKRKKMVNYTTIISLIFIVPLYLTSSCKQNCSSQKKWIESISIFVFRVILEITYQAYYFIQNQIFPMQIRPQALLLTGSASAFTRVLIPIASGFNEKIPFFLPFTFITVGIIILVVMSRIKQTAGVPPPEIIVELEYRQKTTIQYSERSIHNQN